MRKTYHRPRIVSEQRFETSALACAKTSPPPPGHWHFGSAYDTFTGHLAGGFGGSESITGSAGIGYGPGGTSASYYYAGMCGNWVTFAS
jgi:hypothetical protein